MSAISSYGATGNTGGDWERTNNTDVAYTSKKEGSSPTNQNLFTVKDVKLAELKGDNVTVSDEQLIKAIERAVKAVQGHMTSLEFSVHDKTKQIMVKVKDQETGETIREIPSEKTQDLVAKIWEMAGLFVDERR